jgi:hypothetical protein
MAPGADRGLWSRFELQLHHQELLIRLVQHKLQRRYNYHCNSWLYFCHSILLKIIFLQQVSEFMFLEGQPMTGNETF